MDKPKSHNPFRKHGKYKDKVDAMSGLNLMSEEKREKTAILRLKAQAVREHIKKEGLK